MTAAPLDVRLSRTDNDRIARAADLRGVPLSALVRDAALREAENVMAAELTVTLSRELAKVRSAASSDFYSTPKPSGFARLAGQRFYPFT